MKSFEHNLWSVNSNQKIILLYIVIPLFMRGLPTGTSLNELLKWLCDNRTAYAAGSKFQNNLNTALDGLVNNAHQLGFNTSSYGQTPNKIYGLLQCRGDISQIECLGCSQEAKERVREVCGNAMGGRVWFDFCYLRYENYNFISKLDSMGSYFVSTEIAINPDAFKKSTQSLLYNLSVKASGDPAYKGFATGSTSFNPSSDRIYGLVQCWRDLTSKDCAACLSTAILGIQDCCGGKRGSRALLGSCIARYEIYPFLISSATPDSPDRRPAIDGIRPPDVLETTPLKKSSRKLVISLGAVGGGLVGLMMICLLAIRRKVKSACIFGKRVTVTHDQEIREDASAVSILGAEQMMFSLQTLIAATNNFHDDNKLGQGGFGPVYKGKTTDGREIAVKKLSIWSGQGKKEFMNEVKLVAKVQHRNLVKLLGCCAEGAERLLVYEYLVNKSLDTFLFDSEKRRRLDWPTRYNIIMGIARGLLYLHEDSHLHIIHRDIKANNILLDDKLNPKIADFGLARIFAEDETHISTRVAGTYGYMAPEYAMQGQLSVKADVYSFGVLLLEIVSGRKNTEFNLSPETQNLLRWTWILHKRGHILEMIDPTLGGACPREQALRCIHVGLLCTQADAALRPAISTIILMISNYSMTLPNPTKPAFVNVSDSQKSRSSSGHDDPAERDGSSQKIVTPSSASSAASHSPLVRSSENEASITDLYRSE